MKRKYKILAGIIIAEFISALILKILGISLENTVPGLILAFIFFATFLITLYILSKDSDVSPKRRKFCKVLFYLLLFCTAAGGLGSVILLIN